MDRTPGSYTRGSGIGNSLGLWKLFSFFFQLCQLHDRSQVESCFLRQINFFLQDIKALNSSFLAICKDQLELWIYVNNSKFKDWIKKPYLFIVLIDCKKLNLAWLISKQLKAWMYQRYQRYTNCHENHFRGIFQVILTISAQRFDNSTCAHAFVTQQLIFFSTFHNSGLCFRD